MNGLEGAFTAITSHPQEDVNPAKEGDYIGADGLLHCGTCRGKKQCRVSLCGTEKIVPCICECRKKQLEEEEHRLKIQERQQVFRRLRSVSLMDSRLQSATFEAYDITPENEKQYTIARNYAENFPKMYRENQGLLLYGPVGTGKSYTAACIANFLLIRSISVVMTSFVRILQEIQSTPGNEASFLNSINHAKLLIIDDLGAERSTDFAQEKVYNVIDSRVRQGKPMILTTNLTFESMASPTDIKYTRIYDRIFETCYPVQMTGRSRRLDEGNRRFKAMKQLLEAGRS